MTVRLFQDIRALESLRNSDFDAVSAYGEVVDNSIQAGATKIQIKFDTTHSKPGKSSSNHIRSVAFGDDGVGMDAETLHRCLQIGWSSRYNERDGIGRFGVGMTLAAIHECKRVQVWSKKADTTQWLYTYMDLDEISSKDDAAIPEPEAQKSLPAEWASLVSADHGTLVVWSHYDRWSGNAKELAEHFSEFNIWLGRTYRYFIWEDNVSLVLNGEMIKAIDPLYVRTEKTRFPDDPKAKNYDEIKLAWPRDDGKGEASFSIRMSLLPIEFRKKKGEGGNADARARFIDRNQGISILRNRREVFFGELPYWGGATRGWQFEDLDRWWGCEVDFPATLDRAFTIKNIKRGAQPIPELRQTIKSQITPTRESIKAEVRKDWGSTEAMNGVDQAGEPMQTGHEGAETIAKLTLTPKSMIDRGKDKGLEADKLLSTLGDQYDEAQKAKLKHLWMDQPFTIMNASWVGGDFFDAQHLGGSSVLKFNLAHNFHVLLTDLMKRLEDSPSNAPEVAAQLREVVDLLLISYAKAEGTFEPQEHLPAEQFVEHLRSAWGKFLKTYLETWKKKNGIE